MGQWQSARWASGLDLAQNYSNNVGSSHGYGSKTWQWILDLYYPSHELFYCGTSCPATLNITGIISGGGQVASQSIISTGTLNSGVNATFESPSIELLPGFEGTAGSVLDAKYGTCQ